MSQRRLPPTFEVIKFFNEQLSSSKGTLSTSSAQAVALQDLMSRFDEEDSKTWEAASLDYCSCKGNPQLLSIICSTFYPSLDPERHILTCVPIEGINIISTCLIEMLSQDGPFHAITMFPFYQSLYEWLRTNDIDLSFWTADGSDPERWHFHIDALKTLVKPNTRLLVVNFPHNPTGFHITNEEWRELLLWCDARGITVFSDELYQFLTMTDDQRILDSACEVTESAVTLCGLSKCFGMPGLRSGWIVSQNQSFIDKCLNYRYYTTSCGCVPGELLSIVAIKNYKHYLNSSTQIIRKNMKVMDQFMEEFSHLFIWRQPEAGTVGLLELRKPLLEKFGNASELSHQFKEDVGVFILPASKMEFSDQFVRLGLGFHNFGDLLSLFKDFLKRKGF